jgi:hypothetical protein
MNSLANKWVRRVHRWLSPPFIPILMVANMARGTEAGDLAQAVVVPLTVVFSVTGGYLWMMPLIVRWRKGRRMEEGRVYESRLVPNG